MTLFTYAPNYVYEEQIGYTTDIVQYEDGYETRYSRGTPRRQFVLQFTNSDLTAKNNLQTWFDTYKGKTTAFTWVNPLDSVTYNVRFMEDILEITEKDYQIYDISITFIEVI